MQLANFFVELLEFDLFDKPTALYPQSYFKSLLADCCFLGVSF